MGSRGSPRYFSRYADLLAVLDGSGTVSYRYFMGPQQNQVLAEEKTGTGGKTRWAVTDKEGSVRAVVNNATGHAVFDRITYDSFGNTITETTAADGLQVGFTGYVYDRNAWEGLYLFVSCAECDYWTLGKVAYPMKFGMHTEAVEQVIELASKGQILTARRREYPETAVIGSIEEAKRMAWRRGYGTLVWTDIREKEMSKVNGEGYRVPGFAELRRALLPLSATLTTCLRQQLHGPKKELVDDIVADLHSCAMARAVRGKLPGSFFERMYEIYAAGGWPCGWFGDYPHGKFVGYFDQGKE